MARKIIDKRVLEEYKKMNSIGFGKEGFCYLIPGTNDVIKIYHEEIVMDNIKFDDKNSEYIAFPKDILIDQETNVIVANTMSFLPGIFLKDGFPSELEISKLKEAYSILCQELEKFGNVYMKDICLDNIFFDIKSNRFYLIDTSRWHELPDVSILNRIRIDTNLSSTLCENSLSWLKDYQDLREENPKLYDLYISAKDTRYCPFLEFLDAIVLEIETKFNQEVITIGDLTRNVYKKS